ncbi:uncharacterized protein LOC113774549 [Coffea eugenioides]|uniref:uncharacterized protein LOC113774549 n=1 Tax=Coffea eugenioides TaxID=49369 RepID=UPI000F610F18|nr:uncharacterized protein LOC113774549 [Coffea eugenioides]
MALVLFLVFSLLLQGAFGELICEELPAEMCAFSISSSGKRCLLETYAPTDATTKYQCKTSEVAVNINMNGHVETEECIKACGLQRNVVGISSDTLLDSGFASELCSQDCSENCPNIVDLYNDLALAEGLNLSEMCKALKNSPRRIMAQVRSSGSASGPASSAAAPFAAEALNPASVESLYSAAWAPAPLLN